MWTAAPQHPSLKPSSSRPTPVCTLALCAQPGCENALQTKMEIRGHEVWKHGKGRIKQEGPEVQQFSRDAGIAENTQDTIYGSIAACCTECRAGKGT